MLFRRLVISLALVLAASCGGSEAGTDAGSGMDAGRHDAGPSDGGTRDAGSPVDSGASDAGATSDAGADAGTDASTDAGLDCSVVGCGAPVVCGETCAEPCGCCDCAEGDEMTRGDTMYVCTSGCYAPRGTLGNGDHCTSTSECGAGLSCCYPCGIPGCMNQCVPTCTSPGCAGGCPLIP